MVDQIAIELARADTKPADTYGGAFNYDGMITKAMDLHAPRLARGIHQAEFWALREDEVTCRIQVNCAWDDENDKIGRLSFAFLVLPCCDPQELLWVADVNIRDVLPTFEGTTTHGLLIVAYWLGGFYPVVFPYEHTNEITYLEPTFGPAIEVPKGFIHSALQSCFDEEAGELAAEDHSSKYLAAALASAYGHDITFDQEQMTA